MSRKSREREGRRRRRGGDEGGGRGEGGRRGEEGKAAAGRGWQDEEVAKEAKRQIERRKRTAKAKKTLAAVVAKGKATKTWRRREIILGEA